MVSFPDLTKADGLAALDKHLATKSYVEGCVQKREGHRGGRRQGNKKAAPRRPRAGVGGPFSRRGDWRPPAHRRIARSVPG